MTTYRTGNHWGVLARVLKMAGYSTAVDAHRAQRKGSA